MYSAVTHGDVSEDSNKGGKANDRIIVINIGRNVIGRWFFDCSVDGLQQGRMSRAREAS